MLRWIGTQSRLVEVEPGQVGRLGSRAADLGQVGLDPRRKMIAIRAQHAQHLIEPRVALRPGGERRMRAERVHGPEKVRRQRLERLPDRLRADVRHGAAEAA